MVSEDADISEVSVSGPIVITREEIEAVESGGGVLREVLVRCRGYTGYLKRALIPALAGGLLLGLFLAGKGAGVAWIGGVLGAIVILGLVTLAAHMGWIGVEATNSLTGIAPGIESTGVLVALPPITIRPEDIPEEPEPEPMEEPAIAVKPDDLEPEVTEEEEPVCPYCGEALDDRPARTCRHCKTPHHQECWQTNGGCTILGCRSAPRR